MFQKGHKFATGGARRGAGRKPNWFKKKCQQEMLKDKASGLRLVGRISRGTAVVEKLFQNEGQIIRVKTGPSPQDSISANEFLRDSAFGKPKQEVAVDGLTSIDLTSVLAMIAQSRSERGLPDD